MTALSTNDVSMPLKTARRTPPLGAGVAAWLRRAAVRRGDSARREPARFVTSAEVATHTHNLANGARR